MKQRIRLTESDLHRIVKESVKRVLRESTDGNLYAQIQTIDKSLSQIDDDTHVSRFYSDENQITIAVSRSVNHLGKRKIIEMMKNYGYDYSTSGANDEYIMMTFERICRTESKGNKGKVLKEGLEKKVWEKNEELRVLLKKVFSNLNGEERDYLYDMLNNDIWNTVYVALSVLKPYNPIKQTKDQL